MRVKDEGRGIRTTCGRRRARASARPVSTSAIGTMSRCVRAARRRVVAEADRTPAMDSARVTGATMSIAGTFSDNGNSQRTSGPAAAPKPSPKPCDSAVRTRIGHVVEDRMEQVARSIHLVRRIEHQVARRDLAIHRDVARRTRGGPVPKRSGNVEPPQFAEEPQPEVDVREALGLRARQTGDEIGAMPCSIDHSGHDKTLRRHLIRKCACDHQIDHLR